MNLTDLSEKLRRTRKIGNAGRRRRDLSRHNRAAIESLENRTLLSATAATDELLVNQTTSGFQRLTDSNGPSAAMAADGSMLVAWEARDPATDGWDVNARRFDAAGLPTGNEFRVNSETTGSQRSPSVAVGNDGQFVVTWQSNQQDGSGWGVFAQRYTADGSTLGAEFQVNTTASGNQVKPSVAFLPNGDVAIAWSGRGAGDSAGVYLRIFDDAGNPRSSEVAVNETTSGTQSQATITTDSSGRLVVAWSSDPSNGRRQIVARQFNATGMALTGEIQVSPVGGRAFRVGHQSDPAIVADGQGGFIVGWEGRGANDSRGAFFRHFDGTGNSLTDTILANQTTRGRQHNTSILWTPDGYIVSWNGRGSGDSNGVYVREFDTDGIATGSVQRVNQTTRRGQTNSTLAQSPDGFTVVWSGGGDGDRSGVFLRKYQTDSTPVSHSPVLSAVGDKTTVEGRLLTFTVHATDADVPTQTLTYTLDPGAPPTASIDATTGEFRWTTTESDGPGAYDLTVRVSDGTSSDSETITIDVTELNQPPVLATIADRTVSESSQVTFTAVATDPDLPSQDLVYSLGAGAPAGATIDTDSGVFQWMTTESDGGEDFDIIIVATDSSGANDTETVTINVTDVNQPPVLSAIGNRAVVETTTLTFTADASDVDVPQQNLSFSLGPGAPSGAIINSSTGEFSWTPTEADGPGSHSLTVRVTDSEGSSDSETISVTVEEVNQAPVLTTIGDRSVPAGSPLLFTANATDDDTPVQTLTYSLDSGAPSTAVINSATGQFSWTPTAAQAGSTADITVRVSDSAGGSDSETITVSVTGVNQSLVAPELGAIGNRTVDEGGTVTFTATATDADTSAEDLRYSLDSGAPVGATIDPVSGEFTWATTETDGSGSFDVTVRVTDDDGLSDVETITIDVDEVNEAPVLDVIGDKTIAEGSQLAFVVTSTDSDQPLQNRTYSLGPGAPAAAAIELSSGLFTWTPGESDGPGTFEVTIRVTDPEGAVDSETISIVVTEVNQAPVLQDIGDRSIVQDQQLVFQATATDSDSVAQNLVFSLGTGAPVGAAIDANSGNFTWTPTAANGLGTFTVTVVVTDSGGLTDSETISINVTDVNQPPILTQIGDQTASEGQALSFTATATDADTASSNLRYSLGTGAPVGATIDDVSGIFRWIPAETDGATTAPVTIHVTDGVGGADSETFTITVAEVNEAPVLSVIGDRSVAEGHELAFTATATDVDMPAQALLFSLDSGAPTGANIDAQTGAFSWTPAEQDGPGSFDVTVRVTDAAGETASETINISVGETNQFPVLATIGDRDATEGVELSFTATAADVDVPAQTLTYSLDSGAPATATIDASTGVFRWIPDEDDSPGTHDITVRVTDSAGGIDTETIAVSVSDTNAPPVLSAIGSQSVVEGQLLSFTATAVDSDTPTQALTFSLDSGAPAAAAIAPATGVFIWTPSEADGPGSFSLTVRVTDSIGASDLETITINVTEANQSPVLAAIGDQSIQVDTLLTFTATATDSDLPSNSLTFSLDDGAPASATIGSSSGVFAWTPTAADGDGPFPVTIRVTDNHGGTHAETISIEITTVDNSAPVLTAIGNQTVAEGSELSFTVSATDPDLPSDVVMYSLEFGAPATASLNPVTGAFNWTPTEDEGPGTFDVTVTVTDSEGESDSETIQIEVTEQNQPPVLNAIGDQEIDEEQELTFTASATDADIPAQNLSFSLESGAPTGATIDSQTGVFRWTPQNADGPGAFDVTVRVTDGSGGVDSETLTITVNGVNHAPVLGAIGNMNAVEGTPLTFTATATDTELPTDSLTYSLDVGAPIAATIDAATGEFSWTPSELDGPNSFSVTVRVTDTAGLADFETIQIDVAEGNQAPVLASIGDREIQEGGQLLFTAMATDGDLPAQTLTYTLDAGAPDGATIRPNDGFFSWTPSAANGDGPFSITVRVTDANGADDFETITVSLVDFNHFPVLATIGNKAAVEGVELSFTATATDENLPSDTLTFSLDASSPAAATIDPVSGVFRWTPSEADGPGLFEITVRVTDDSSATDFETITVSVAEANQDPVLVSPGDRTVPERTHLTFTVVATDADLPVAPLLYFLEAGAPPTASLNTTSGVFGWTPSEADGPGTFNVTFRVIDNRGGTDAETIQITVTEANVAPVLGVIGSRTIRIDNDLSFSAVATDTDLPANTLTYSLDAGAPAGASIDPSNGSFHWTPTVSDGIGTHTFTVRVTDDGGLSDFETISVDVTEANQPPVLDTVGDKTIIEGTQLTFSVSATDPDAGDVLTYSLDAGAPAGAVINSSNGTFSWVPAEIQGPSTVSMTIRVTDADGESDFETISIDVTEANLPPVLDPVGNKTGSEGVELSFGVTATDPDLPANILTYSLDAGAPVNASITPDTGQFTWTPDESDGPGSHLITVRVTDNHGETDSEEIRVDVPETNQPPVLDAIGDQNGQEGERLRFDVIATDPDLPAQTLTYSLDAGQPAGAVIDPVTGAFDWTPNMSVGSGTFSVTVRVDDGAGGSDSETFSITIAEGMTALDEYVAIDDPSYGYTPNAPISGAGYTMHILDLTSQTWMDSSIVQEPVWKHWVSIIVPDGATSETAVLFIDGGSNPASAPTSPDSDALTLALSYGQILVHVPTIPNQPQVFLEEGVGRVEDEIIAYTFDKYLNTGDESYPLLLPMVKSAVAAMDATQDYALGQAFNIDDFYVTGASKRGWTSWLTAAVDARVSALAPLVIDFLNIDEQMPHHRDNYTGVTDQTTGGYSNSVHDYVDLNIMSRLSTPEGQALLKIVDPYEYRDRLTQPKYLVNGAGDQFFVPDSGQFYLSDLQGPTYVRYVPNADHSLNADATQGLANFLATVDEGTALPEFTWAVEGNREVIRVNTVDAPTTVRMWQASNPNSLDFRQQTFGANWTSSVLTDQGGGEYVGQVPHPATGGTAFFVELTYEVNGRTLTFTTEASIAKPLTVTNTAPVLDPVGDQIVNEGQLLTFDATATDSDLPAQTLTYSLDVGAPAGAEINAATGQFTWTPTEEFGPGTFNLTVRVTDSQGSTDSEEISIGVIEVNQPPVLAAVGDKLVSENNELSFVATATDPDRPQNSLTYSLDAGAPAAATIDPASGLFRWSPSTVDGPGTFGITVRVTDSEGASDFEDITVQVTEGVASSVIIDGNFDDWAMLSSYVDAADDQHDTDHTDPSDTPEYVDHQDVDLLEFKVTHDAENFYFYFRATGEIGRTQTEDIANGKRAGRYYAIVTIDVDNDDTTGYGLHGGGYFPTTDGYDMNGELEFYGGAINTGHYLLHGAQDDAELEQSFDEQSQGQYVFGGNETQGPFTPGFVNIVPGDYDHYTQWVYKDNDPANGGNDSITFVQDKGPVIPGIVTHSLSGDGHELEMKVPFRGFLVDSVGNPIVSLGQTVDISFSLEASGELSNSVSPLNPNGTWASDTADPLVGYVLDPVSTSFSGGGLSDNTLPKSDSFAIETETLQTSSADVPSVAYTVATPAKVSLFAESEETDIAVLTTDTSIAATVSVEPLAARSWINAIEADGLSSWNTRSAFEAVVETVEVPVSPDSLLPEISTSNDIDTAFLPAEWDRIQTALNDGEQPQAKTPQKFSRLKKIIPHSRRIETKMERSVLSLDAHTGRATVIDKPVSAVRKTDSSQYAADQSISSYQAFQKQQTSMNRYRS